MVAMMSAALCARLRPRKRGATAFASPTQPVRHAQSAALRSLNDRPLSPARVRSAARRPQGSKADRRARPPQSLARFFTPFFCVRFHIVVGHSCCEDGIKASGDCAPDEKLSWSRPTAMRRMPRSESTQESAEDRCRPKRDLPPTAPKRPTLAGSGMAASGNRNVEADARACVTSSRLSALLSL